MGGNSRYEEDGVNRMLQVEILVGSGMGIYKVGKGVCDRGENVAEEKPSDRSQKTWKVQCGVAEFMENDGPSYGTKALRQGLKTVP